MSKLQTHSGVKPQGWVVLGQGALADEVRATIAADPDRFRPETWSINPVGHCPCCDADVYRCTTRHTGWMEGFATHANVVHPQFNAKGERDPKGGIAGCCCEAPNWSKEHDKQRRPAKKKRRARR